MPTPTEAQEQAALVEWLTLKGWMFTATAQATPAGSMRGGRWTPNFTTLRKNKALGVRKGFPDLCVVSPGHRVAFIELKRRNGVPSDVAPEQRQWLYALGLSGIPAAVCFGAADAIAFCEAFHNFKKWGNKVCEGVPQIFVEGGFAGPETRYLVRYHA